MSFVEKVEQWNREISGSFDRAVSDLRRQVQERLHESHQELDRRIEAFAPPLPVLAHEDLAPAADHLRGQARGGAFGELRDALAALDRARSQSAVLAALIAGAGHFASRAALLLSRGGELRGWGGQGFGGADQALPDLALTPSAGSPWGRFAGGGTDAAGGQPAAGAVQLSAAECAVLCGRIESPMPAFGVLVPLVLRDRTVAALYADQLPEGPERPAAAPGQAGTLSLPALQSLVYVAALAIESLPFRQREATATLQPAGAAGETGQPAAVAAAAAPVPAALAVAAVAKEQELAAPEALAAPEEPAAAPGSAAGAAVEAAPASVETPVAPGTLATPATPETSAAADAAAAAAPAAPAAQAPEPPFAVTPAGLYDAPGVPVLKETAEIPTPRPLWPVPPPSPAAAPEADTAGAPSGEVPDLDEAAAAPEPAAPAPEAAGDRETVLLPRAGLRDAGGQGALRAVPSGPHVAAGLASGAAAASGAGTNPGATLPHPPSLTPVPPASPLFEPLRTGPLASGTPEVRPPSGVQGPGWAFATTRIQASSSEEALHEEARRLARLLVSEIKLYNEEQVEAGRRNRDIYERLREDIDRSRQMYEERVEPRLVKSTDYFYQELVRILAAGDSKALGI
jgi:hypothetical protein